MKNSHVNIDRSNPTDGYKRFKRKFRDSVKREEKSSHDSEKSIDSVEPLLGEVYGKTREKKLQHSEPAGKYIQQPDILNTAFNMKMYALPSLSRNETKTPLWSISETPVEKRNDRTSLQVSVFDNRKVFPANYPLQARSLMCKRSESSPCSTSSRGSYFHNSDDPTDSLRKRSEEQSAGVVTEIKAIQQTRRLLANARERTRVHTISAAFEALRKQVSLYYLVFGEKKNCYKSLLNALVFALARLASHF